MLLNSTIIVAAISGFSGAIIAGAANFVTRWFDRRSDERKHYRELSIRAAIAAWEQHIELQKFKLETLKQSVSIAALDVYIVRMVRLIEIASDTKLSPEELTERMKKLQPFDDAMIAIGKPRQRTTSGTAE